MVYVKGPQGINTLNVSPFKASMDIDTAQLLIKLKYLILSPDNIISF